MSKQKKSIRNFGVLVMAYAYGPFHIHAEIVKNDSR